MSTDLWLLAFIALTSSAVLLSLYIKCSHSFHWFDRPDEDRKLHSVAKPTSAGLVFMLPLVVYLLLFPLSGPINTYAIVAIISTLLVVGGVDDFKPISVIFRLSVISNTACVFLYVVFREIDLSLWLFLLYSLGLIWWLNLYNFMDGADGMTALHAIVTMAGYVVIFASDVDHLTSFLPYQIIFIAGLLAFLGFNFPKSRLFMGDAGSLSVAFFLAVFALYGLSLGLFDEMLIISFHLVFIIDTTLTLLTRIKFKHRLTQAHNLHFYQIMIKRGNSHALVSSLYAIVTVVTIGVALTLHFYQMEVVIKITVLLLEVIILSALWILFHAKTKFEQFIQ